MSDGNLLQRALEPANLRFAWEEVAVIEPDARLEKEYGRLLVTREDQTILRVPIQHVSSVVLVGNAGATTQALHALLQVEVPLFLVSRSGKHLGTLSPPTGKNVLLRKAQYLRDEEPGFRLDLARQIVAGKIHNQYILAQRLARRRKLDKQKELSRLRGLKDNAINAPDPEKLLGIEGESARLYFSIFLNCFDPRWMALKRTRRPPKDAVNALLSLGYTFLGNAAMAALETVGLDPYLGYFHTEKYGRPALALDLIEEFRTPVVDSLVLDILNHGMLSERDFQIEAQERAVYLTPHGMRLFVHKFARKLESCVSPREIGRQISYRKLIEVQARRLAAVIRGESPRYQPFRLR